MAFHEFNNNNGTPNIYALIEQVALVTCLYWNRQSHYEQIIAKGGGGQVVRWVFTPTVWPPSFAICRQGDRYFVSLADTTNETQWFLHFAGAFGEKYLDGETAVHAFWWKVWKDNLADQIINAIGIPATGKKIYAFGDSYGGALAQLLGNDYALLLNPESVQVLTTGQPKPLCSGYEGPQASVHLRVAHPQDPVSVLPTVNFNASVERLIPGRFLFSKPLDWIHYGDGFLWGPNGQLVANTIAPVSEF